MADIEICIENLIFENQKKKAVASLSYEFWKERLDRNARIIQELKRILDLNDAKWDKLKLNFEEIKEND